MCANVCPPCRSEMVVNDVSTKFRKSENPVAGVALALSGDDLGNLLPRWDHCPKKSVVGMAHWKECEKP